MEYVLTADGLCKQYGNYKVLNGLSLHVPKGAVYGLVGKNGAGKTTFIRIICGLQRPGAGDFTLYGTSGKSREIIRVRRRIGAVVETPSLYLDMSAEDNLKMQYRILGLPSFEGIGELLALVGSGRSPCWSQAIFWMNSRSSRPITASLTAGGWCRR